MNRSYSKIRHIQESNRILETRTLINEEKNQDFLNLYLEDFKKMGFTVENMAREVLVTKGGLTLSFVGSNLQKVKVRTRISIYNMGSDSLSNQEFAKSFRAYDNSDKIMTAPNSEELGNFKNWVSSLNASTIGATKETTPFYAYYADLVKLSKISDKYANFNSASIKDKAKEIGKEFKNIGQKIKSTGQKVMSNVKSNINLG